MSKDLAATIEPRYLVDGDCFNILFDSIHTSGTITEVELVPCSGEWYYRVLNRVVVEEPVDQHQYPEEEFFHQEAEKQ
jgi:hypothetical protein